MTKDRVINTTCPYVVSAHRQHNSIVATIPKAICVALGIEAGDIVCFDLQCGKGYAIFSLQLKGPKNAEGYKSDKVGRNRSR